MNEDERDKYDKVEPLLHQLSRGHEGWTKVKPFQALLKNSGCWVATVEVTVATSWTLCGFQPCCLRGWRTGLGTQSGGGTCVVLLHMSQESGPLGPRTHSSAPIPRQSDKRGWSGSFAPIFWSPSSQSLNSANLTLQS